MVIAIFLSYMAIAPSPIFVTTLQSLVLGSEIQLRLITLTIRDANDIRSHKR